VESHLKLAEIFHGELKEPTQAIDHWKEALEMEASDQLRREIAFKVADAYLQTNQLEDALWRFMLIIADGQDKHLAEKARGRAGNIFLVRGEYERAITMFTKVLENTECEDCRLRAQLDLVESYQYLDRLQEAIETAERITHPDYPRAALQDLLERLSKKREYSPRHAEWAKFEEEKNHEDA
jgi:tetratricopeptide (TPR) repeat protein